MFGGEDWLDVSSLGGAEASEGVHWAIVLAIVALAVVVLGCCLGWWSVEGFTEGFRGIVPDAYGRWSGVGTPLDFPEIRGQGVNFSEGFDVLPQNACAGLAPGAPVGANFCALHGDLPKVQGAGRPKVTRLLDAPNGCKCTCLCPKEESDRLGVVRQIGVNDLTNPNPASTAVARAQQAAQEANKYAEMAKEVVASSNVMKMAPGASDLVQQAKNASQDANNLLDAVMSAYNRGNQRDATAISLKAVSASQNAYNAVKYLQGLARETSETSRKLGGVSGASPKSYGDLKPAEMFRSKSLRAYAGNPALMSDFTKK